MIKITAILLALSAVIFGGCSAQVSTSRSSTVVVDSEIVRSIQAAGGQVSIVNGGGSVIIGGNEVDPERMPQAIRKRVRADFERSAFTRIMVTTPVDVPVVTMNSRDSRVHVGGSVLAATEAEIDAFFDSSSRDVRGRDVRFRVGPAAYNCAYAVINGREGIFGVCIERVSVALPTLPDATVYVNGIPAAAGTAIDSQVLLEALQDSASDFDRARVVTRLVRFLGEETITEGLFEEILGTFGHDYERKEATQLLVGRVRGEISGETMARLVSRFNGDYDREMALRSMARHSGALDGAQAMAILRAFRADHDRSQAAEALVRSGNLTLTIEELPQILRLYGDSDYNRRQAMDALIGAVSTSLTLPQMVNVLGSFRGDYDRQEACESLSRRLDRGTVSADALASLSRLFRSDYERGQCTQAIIGE